MCPIDGAFWVCCIFPHLALETLDLAEAEARPLALVSKKEVSKREASKKEARGKEAAGKPRSSQQTVQACNEAARSEGVVPGMALAAAYSRCPQLLCRDRQPAQENVRLKQLADIAYGYTSDVSLVPVDDHGHGLLLECAGSLKLFGGGAALMQSLQLTWQQLEHHCDMGVAHTPLAAETLARARLRLPPAQEFLAERARQALQHVRLAHSPWQPKVIERFLASGLRTLGDVLALPRAAVGRRFGTALLRDMDRLIGALPDPRPPITPQSCFHACVHLLEDLRHRDGLIFPMRRLLTDLSAWLRLRQLATDRIAWRFSDGRRTPVSVEVSLARPSLDVGRLLELSKLQLERTALMPEINTVQLQSLDLTQTQGESLSLFTYGANGSDQRQTPAHLLDLFQARLGEEGLRGITLADDHRPELSWRTIAPRTVAPTATPRSAVLRPAVPRDRGEADHRLRPLWLLPEPQRIADETLQLLRGPERIDVAWWALAEHHQPLSISQDQAQAAALNPTVARDYYIARDANGVLCWVYQAHENSGWFLHGYFA